MVLLGACNHIRPCLPTPNSDATAKRASTLAARGLYHKILEDDEIFVASGDPGIEEKLKNLFAPRIWIGLSSKNGCAVAVQANQIALDEGFIILSTDAANAFNALKRTPAFQYLVSRGKIYQPLFAYTNLFYARSTVCHLFARDGSIILSQTITNGTSQGCVSGPIFLHWAQLPLLGKHRNSLSIADDIHIVLPTATAKLRIPASHPADIINDFAQIGLDLTASI